MDTMTGRGPVKRLAGLYRIPEIIRPSKVLHCTTCGGGSTFGLNVVSLNVQRVSAPLEMSTEYTSPCALTDPRVNAISWDRGRQCIWETTPACICGSRTGLMFFRSMT